MRIVHQLKDTLGAYVVGVKRVGPADLGGLRPGDVVRDINRQPVEHLSDFIEDYNRLTSEELEKTMLTVLRGTATRLVVLNIEEDADQEAGSIDE